VGGGGGEGRQEKNRLETPDPRGQLMSTSKGLGGEGNGQGSLAAAHFTMGPLVSIDFLVRTVQVRGTTKERYAKKKKT